MIDMYTTRKKLIIVHSDNTAVFANYLQMLISSNNDKDDKQISNEDGLIETTIWSEKQYIDQKPTLSSVDHILFVGGGEVLSKETYGITVRFDKYGMKYGWLGKYAFLYIIDKRLNKNEFSGFLEFAKKYNPALREEKIFSTDVPSSKKMEYLKKPFSFYLLDLRLYCWQKMIIKMTKFVVASIIRQF